MTASSSTPSLGTIGAVRLEEGPVMISNLSGTEPEGSWIGRAVTLRYEDDGAGRVIQRVRLADPSGSA